VAENVRSLVRRCKIARAESAGKSVGDPRCTRGIGTACVRHRSFQLASFDQGIEHGVSIVSAGCYEPGEIGR
jgi:hypothetical protein